MIPSFISNTFPNHYTLVTGLYPSVHGIVDNNMYDPEWKRIFTLNDTKEVNNGSWYGGEPIWVTSRKNNLKSAAIFWPGSEALIEGLEPNYFVPFNSSLSYRDRVLKGISWLKENTDTAIILFYFEGVDSSGHQYGPEFNVHMEEEIRKVDQAIALLVSDINGLNLFTTNLIIVSDHGMSQVKEDQIISLDKCINISDTIFISYGATTGIFPQESKEIQLMEQLSSCNTNMTVFKKEDFFPSLHYSSNRRIPPILILANQGWYITNSAFKYSPRGAHGYNTNITDMRAFFLAHGPAFNTTPPNDQIIFHNLDVYPLLAGLLGIPPAQNNGTLELVGQLLKK
uniref:AP3A hydrolase n=1 Tax=Arcella intermedia TaxID=1963864 RepID=A0A6B2L6L6_9EUKA